jgi:DNA invertase Pin-like site-specific DNA recombinase
MVCKPVPYRLTGCGCFGHGNPTHRRFHQLPSRQHPTSKGRSGLGIEAQRAAVANYLNGGNWQIIAEFKETESGKRADRPELDKAPAEARLYRVPVVVANVSRLTRSSAFLHRFLDAGVDVRFADLPAIEGPTGRFMLQQMASVAELEAGMISVRTQLIHQMIAATTATADAKFRASLS